MYVRTQFWRGSLRFILVRQTPWIDTSYTGKTSVKHPGFTRHVLVKRASNIQDLHVTYWSDERQTPNMYTSCTGKTIVTHRIYTSCTGKTIVKHPGFTRRVMVRPASKTQE